MTDFLDVLAPETRSINQFVIRAVLSLYSSTLLNPWRWLTRRRTFGRLTRSANYARNPWDGAVGTMDRTIQQLNFKSLDTNVFTGSTSKAVELSGLQRSLNISMENRIFKLGCGAWSHALVILLFSLNLKKNYKLFKKKL